MTTHLSSTVRPGAIGLALGMGVAGLLHVVATLGFALLLSSSVGASVWGPRWLLGAALVLVGVAGVIAARAPKVRGLAAGLAGLGALAVVVVVVWSLDPVRQLAYIRPAMWWTLAHVVIVLLVLAAAWGFTRPETVTARGGAGALGAVIGVAAATLPDLAQQVPYLRQAWSADGSFFSIVNTLGLLLLVLAAVLAAVALASRLPAAIVAAVAAAAGLLLLLAQGWYVRSMADFVLDGVDGGLTSLALNLAAGAGQALVVLGLAVALVLSRRSPSSPAAVDDAPTPWQTPTP